MNNTEDSQLVKFTGLWKHKAQNGTTYLRGNVSPGCSLLIFPARQDDEFTGKGPDYVAYFAPNRPSNGNENGNRNKNANANANENTNANANGNTNTNANGDGNGEAKQDAPEEVTPEMLGF